MGALGEIGRRARARVLGASSEATSVRFRPGVRVRAPSVVDSGHSASFGAGVGELTALLPWEARRSFRMRAGAMVQCSVLEPVAGPQPNNVRCWQPG